MRCNSPKFPSLWRCISSYACLDYNAPIRLLYNLRRCMSYSIAICACHRRYMRRGYCTHIPLLESNTNISRWYHLNNWYQGSLLREPWRLSLLCRLIVRHFLVFIDRQRRFNKNPFNILWSRILWYGKCRRGKSEWMNIYLQQISDKSKRFLPHWM